jgi:hypothetical protein
MHKNCVRILVGAQSENSMLVQVVAGSCRQLQVLCSSRRAKDNPLEWCFCMNVKINVT